MEWAVIIGITAVCYGIIYYLNVSKKNKLKTENKIIDRDAIFFKREHIFETSVSSLREIGDAIDKSTLGSESISFEPDYEHGIIIFHNTVSFGTFGAALRMSETADGIYRYRFKIDAWRETNGGISRQDFFNANVLLTAIEKAFLKLDARTRVSDQATTIKSRHSLF